MRRAAASLLLPDPPSDPQLELLPVATREEEGHVALDDEPVVAVPDLPVAVPDAPRHALPCHLAPVPSDLQAVAVVLGLGVVAHETEEGDVHGRHAQLESLEVQAEVLAEAAENLEEEDGLVPMETKTKTKTQASKVGITSLLKKKVVL